MLIFFNPLDDIFGIFDSRFLSYFSANFLVDDFPRISASPHRLLSFEDSKFLILRDYFYQFWPFDSRIRNFYHFFTDNFSIHSISNPKFWSFFNSWTKTWLKINQVSKAPNLPIISWKIPRTFPRTILSKSDGREFRCYWPDYQVFLTYIVHPGELINFSVDV